VSCARRGRGLLKSFGRSSNSRSLVCMSSEKCGEDSPQPGEVGRAHVEHGAFDRLELRRRAERRVVIERLAVGLVAANRCACGIPRSLPSFCRTRRGLRNLSAERPHFDAVPHRRDAYCAPATTLSGPRPVIFRARQRLRFFVGIAAAAHAIADLFAAFSISPGKGVRRAHEHDCCAVIRFCRPARRSRLRGSVQTTLETIDPARFHWSSSKRICQTAAEDERRF